MSTKQKHILGIDGGGTKTDMVLADEKGRILARVKIGPSNLHNVTVIELKKEWRKGIKKLYKIAKIHSQTKLTAVGIGLAGLDSNADKLRAHQLVRQALGAKLPKSSKRIRVVNDTVIGFWSGCKENYGIGIVGGTGSNCYGRNKRGKEAWASGLGHILADEGGGYYMGLRVLKAAVKSADGRGPKTMLEKMVLKHFKVKTIRDLVPIVYYKTFGKYDIGQLAYYVEEAYLKGDKVAKAIAHDAADELVAMIRSVANKVGLAKYPFRIVMIGGVLQHDPIVTKRFKREVRRLYPKAKFVVPKKDPVMGAVRMALAILK